MIERRRSINIVIIETRVVLFSFRSVSLAWRVDAEVECLLPFREGARRLLG